MKKGMLIMNEKKELLSISSILPTRGTYSLFYFATKNFTYNCFLRLLQANFLCKETAGESIFVFLLFMQH